MSFPKHKIETMTFEESHYNFNNKRWNAKDLYEFAEAKKYEPFDLPLCAVDLSKIPFSLKDLDEFIFQMKRVEDTSLEFPILISDKGQIADGYHRICKAILEGRETIKAIRLLEMPNPTIIE